MNKTKATPGSWRALPTHNAGEKPYVESDTRGPRLCTMNGDTAEDFANARLIAAATELLSVAEGVLAALSYPRASEAQIRCLEEIGQDAVAAITKVRGTEATNA